MINVFNKAYQPWQVKAEEYPEGNSQKQLEWLLSYAVLAPSTFNAQPWACKVDDKQIELFLDTARLPTKSDKSGRFGFISLGCFIENLTIAAECFGWTPNVQYNINKSGNRYTSVATISMGQSLVEAREAMTKLLGAMTARATNRSPRTSKPLPVEVVKKINETASAAVKVNWLGSENKDNLIGLSEVADMAIWSDKEFRKEHIEWVRPNWTLRDDGMPGFGVGIKDIPSLLAKPIILSSKFATMQTAKNKHSLAHTTDYLVLSSPDTPEDWLNIGRVYEHIALLCATYGLAVAPMGQFIEHGETRGKLAQVVETNYPQLFCRIGYPTETVHHSPRRSVPKILI